MHFMATIMITTTLRRRHRAAVPSKCRQNDVMRRIESWTRDRLTERTPLCRESFSVPPAPVRRNANFLQLMNALRRLQRTFYFIFISRGINGGYCLNWRCIAMHTQPVSSCEFINPSLFLSKCAQTCRARLTTINKCFEKKKKLRKKENKNNFHFALERTARPRRYIFLSWKSNFLLEAARRKHKINTNSMISYKFDRTFDRTFNLTLSLYLFVYLRQSLRLILWLIQLPTMANKSR